MPDHLRWRKMLATRARTHDHILVRSDMKHKVEQGGHSPVASAAPSPSFAGEWHELEFHLDADGAGGIHARARRAKRSVHHVSFPVEAVFGDGTLGRQRFDVQFG